MTNCRKTICGLKPPWFGGRLFQDNGVEICDRFLESILNTHQRVLVLNADCAIVAIRAQCPHARLPELLAVSVANGAEHPSAFVHFTVAFRVQIATRSAAGGVDVAVLGMEVKQAVVFAQEANCLQRIDSLPPEMAGVEIGADVFSGEFAQTDDVLGAVHHHAWMCLESDFRAVFACKLLLACPVCDGHVPLVIGCFAEFGWPRTRYEVWDRVFARAGGAPGEIDNNGLKLRGQHYAVVVHLLMDLGDGSIGMQGVAVGGNALYYEPCVRDFHLQFGEAFGFLVNFLQVPRVTRVWSYGQLDGLQPNFLAVGQCFLNFHATK